MHEFSEGDKDQRDLLGGKGANLAEMVNLGLPVPPGFTIDTEACKAYLAAGRDPDGLADEVTSRLAALEDAMGRRLGDAKRPAAGLGPLGREVLDARDDGDGPQRRAQRRVRATVWPRRARTSGSRGTPIAGSSRCSARPSSTSRGRSSPRALDDAKKAKGTEADLDLDEQDLRALVATFKDLVREHAGRDFPQEPREQLDLAVRAVFDSWNTERAVLYRRQERIPEDLGTAVNVQAMVFGNRGMDSGSGVAFTRDPASGAQGEYGDYLQNAQGEDVVAGIRNTVSLADMQEVAPGPHAELMRIMATLEHHYRDMCDIEFTVENDKLWMLQTRVGKRTPEAAFRIAVHMADEGLIDMDEALRRVTGEQLAQLMFPRFDAGAPRDLLAKGMNASPGAAVGKIVFDTATAVEWAERGEDVILVRQETNPDDLHGMMVARGVLTSRGGKTSHAAVVARGMGRTCVCGAESLDVDAERKRLVVRRGRDARRGRRHLDRRHHRGGLRRRGAGDRLAGRASLRGRARRQ